VLVGRLKRKKRIEKSEVFQELRTYFGPHCDVAEGRLQKGVVVSYRKNEGAKGPEGSSYDCWVGERRDPFVVTDPRAVSDGLRPAKKEGQIGFMGGVGLKSASGDIVLKHLPLRRRSTLI